jgi:RNA polymerase sigma-70 factor (ECF subfamily)
VQAQVWPAAADGEAVEDRDLVRRSMAVLSDDERVAVSLRYGADLTMPEIARVIGEPLTTVEGRIYRALGKLRTELAAASESGA